ncbi:MAG: hypothetical protein JWQ42_2613 [Edaphobacter sp.]|nr:hypothetical protein [Edaphobacter sp.]
MLLSPDRVIRSTRTTQLREVTHETNKIDSTRRGLWNFFLLLRQPRGSGSRRGQSSNANDKSAIIRWTSNNPGGSDEHFGVVHCGTNSQGTYPDCEISHQGKPELSIYDFRVRVEGLTGQRQER